MNKLQYPIGKFSIPTDIEKNTIHAWINDLRTFPAQLSKLIDTLNQAALQQQYRRDGWTIIQIVHHCADSHMNAFIRCKLTLTEDKPTIKDYHEALWAAQPDGILPSPHTSLQLLNGLHPRWCTLFENLPEVAWHRTYFHPGQGREFSLLEVLGLYSWHSRHHLSHIKLALDQPFSRDQHE